MEKAGPKHLISQDQEKSQTGVKIYFKILRWFLMAVCLIWVLRYFNHHRQYLDLFVSLSLPVILALLGMAALHLGLYALQFYLVLRACTSKLISFFVFFKTIIIGRLLSNIAPQSGNVYRAVFLKYQFGVSYTHYLSSFLAFLWIDAAMNILLSVFIFGLFAPSFCIQDISIWWFLIVMAAAWFLPIVLEAVLRRNSFRVGSIFEKLHMRMSELLQVTVQSLLHGRMLLWVMAANIVNFINNTLIFYLCLSGFGVSVTIPALITFFILMKITSYLMLTPGNFGLREIAYAFISEQMGMEAGQGIVLSIMHRLAVLIAVIGFAVCFEGIKLFDDKGKNKGVGGREDKEN